VISEVSALVDRNQQEVFLPVPKQSADTVDAMLLAAASPLSSHILHAVSVPAFPLAARYCLSSLGLNNRDKCVLLSIGDDNWHEARLISVPQFMVTGIDSLNIPSFRAATI
jgi:hypothetical protein